MVEALPSAGRGHPSVDKARRIANKRPPLWVAVSVCTPRRLFTARVFRAPGIHSFRDLRGYAIGQ